MISRKKPKPIRLKAKRSCYIPKSYDSSALRWDASDLKALELWNSNQETRNWGRRVDKKLPNPVG